MAINNNGSRGGIDFGRPFGAAGNTTQTNNNADQPKAELWLNIGYTAEGAGKDGEDMFVSLPVGIPLDTQKPVNAASKNEAYSMFQQARNSLLEQIQKFAESLEPGEAATLQLEVQVRRVEGERAPVQSDNNPFMKQLVFNG